MAETHAPTSRVAILAFPEATASVVYGMYDILLSAGRDWGVIVDGRPGALTDAAGGGVAFPRAVRDLEWRAASAPSRRSTSARRRTSSSCRKSRSRRVRRSQASTPRSRGCGAATRPARRCATACSGAMLLAQAGLLDEHDATTHWAYCDVMRTRLSAHDACTRSVRSSSAARASAW